MLGPHGLKLLFGCVSLGNVTWVLAGHAEWFSVEFTEKYGGISCSAILDDDPGNRTVRCPVLVAGVYEKVKALLVENGFHFTQARQ